jgi:alpha-amylase
MAVRSYYSNDQQFGFGGWRRDDRPIPTELRRPDFYHRRGQIGNYDAYPEVQHGDISSLKDYDNDDDGTGSDVINALIKAHCYWIREADVDGFRVDAVKHLGTAFMAMTSTIRHTRVRITPSQCDISLAARALGCRCAGEPWVL